MEAASEPCQGSKARGPRPAGGPRPRTSTTPERKPGAGGTAGASCRERLPPFAGDPAHWARPVPPATHRIRFPHNGAKSSGESLREGLAAGSVRWAFSEGPRERRDRKAPFYGSLPPPPPRHKLASSEHRTSRLPPGSSQSVMVPPTAKRSPRPRGALGKFPACGRGRGFHLGCGRAQVQPCCPPVRASSVAGPVSSPGSRCVLTSPHTESSGPGPGPSSSAPPMAFGSSFKALCLPLPPSGRDGGVPRGCRHHESL